MKRCAKCKEEFPLDIFTRDRSRKDGRYPYCKPCHRATQRAITTPEQKRERYERTMAKRAANTELREQYLVRTAMWSIKKRYGIDSVAYLAMYQAQRGACAICGVVPAETERRRNILCVDHNHNTGAVRALLCDGCNMGLGSFRDDLEVLRKAVAYLEHHEAQA